MTKPEYSPVAKIMAKRQAQPTNTELAPLDPASEALGRQGRELARRQATQPPFTPFTPSTPPSTPSIPPSALPSAVQDLQPVKAVTHYRPFEAAMTEEEALFTINHDHAVILNLGGSGKCVVMEWADSKINCQWQEPSYRTFASFRELHSNQYVQSEEVTSKGKKLGVAPLGAWWLTQPSRHQYADVDLIPNAPNVLPGNRLNLWKGFGVEPKQGDWSPLKYHLHDVLAAGDPKSAEYILKWTAWKFQHPGERPEVSMVFKGKKGTGKGLWMTVALKVFGPHGVQIHKAEHLTGKHNKHLQNKLLVCADEAVWGGDKDAERVLKGMVTDPTLMIEPKGVDAFEWLNRLGIIMSANETWVVPATEDERRWAVFAVSPKHRKEEAYFTPLFDEINNGDLVAAMLHDMLRMDLGKWHPRYNIPQTSALLEQKTHSLGGLDQWWLAKLNTGQTPTPQKNNPRHIISANLLDEAKRYSERNRYVTETEFGRFMRELGCQHKSTGAKWGWVLKPLAEHRADWEARFEAKFDWLEPDIADWNANLTKVSFDRFYRFDDVKQPFIT